MIRTVFILLAAGAAFTAAYLTTRARVAEPTASEFPAGVERVECRGTVDGWEFRYPGRDGVIGTADDRVRRDVLRLPASRRVTLLIVSDDYLYRFAQPELGVNVVAVPGIETTCEISTGRGGRYQLDTQPLCGTPLLHQSEPPAIVVAARDE